MMRYLGDLDDEVLVAVLDDGVLGEAELGDEDGRRES